MISPWLVLPLGLGLILLTIVDVLLTILHIQVESPISSALHRWSWRGLLGLTRWLPEGARGAVLTWGTPLMISGTIGLWVASCILGFGLLYTPAIHDPSVFSVQSPGSALADALYFSAASFLTIGYGDIVPLQPLARFLAILEGGFGLLTVTLSVAYLLAVYPVISRKLALAQALNQETAGRPDGVAMAARYLAAGRHDALGDRLRWLNDELLALGRAHDLYPVLYYVRPSDVHESFARVLTLVEGIVATLRYGLDPAVHRDVAADPSLAVLEEGLLHTLHGLGRSSHLAVGDEGEHAGGAQADFRALQAALTAAGLAAIAADDPSAAERHARFRAATRPYIRAYAAAAGYEPEAVWATYSRWSRDTAPVVHRDEHGRSTPRGER